MKIGFVNECRESVGKKRIRRTVRKKTGERMKDRNRMNEEKEGMKQGCEEGAYFIYFSSLCNYSKPSCLLLPWRLTILCVRVCVFMSLGGPKVLKMME